MLELVRDHASSSLVKSYARKTENIRRKYAAVRGRRKRTEIFFSGCSLVVAVAGRAVWGVPNDPPNPQAHRYGHAMRRAVLRIYRGTRRIPLQAANVRKMAVEREPNAQAMVLVVIRVRPGRVASARACVMAPQWPRKCQIVAGAKPLELGVWTHWRRSDRFQRHGRTE